MDVVVEPNVLLISVVVVVAQLFAAATLLSGRNLLAGIAVGAFLNLNFVAIGAVDPSIFYLICQPRSCCGRSTVRGRGPSGCSPPDPLRWRRSTCRSSPPSTRTRSSRTPAIILVTLGPLVATTSVLSVWQSHTPRHPAVDT